MLIGRRVGDILETVNGQSMTNADHREAVRAVKESKGTLSVVGLQYMSHCPQVDSVDLVLILYPLDTPCLTFMQCIQLG